MSERQLIDLRQYVVIRLEQLISTLIDITHINIEKENYFRGKNN